MARATRHTQVYVPSASRHAPDAIFRLVADAKGIYIYKLTIYCELYWEVLKFHFSVTAKIPPVQGASPLIYRGLHLALESVAVKSLNIYGTKIWRSVQFYIPLYPRKESCCAFKR